MCKLVRILKVKKMQICKKIKVNFRKKIITAFGIFCNNKQFLKFEHFQIFHLNVF